MIHLSRVITYSQGGRKNVVTIVRCIRTENFPLREIGTWEKVRYNGGYVVTRLDCILLMFRRSKTLSSRRSRGLAFSNFSLLRKISVPGDRPYHCSPYCAPICAPFLIVWPYLCPFPLCVALFVSLSWAELSRRP